MSILTKKVRLGPILFALVAVVLAFGTVLTLGAINGVPFASLFSVTSRTSDSQVVRSVTNLEEVALLGLGIQGLAREDSKGEILGAPVPAGDRTTIIQYEFSAKIGIDGQDVEIVDPEADNSYLVTIPRFAFIGYDNPKFEDPIENNGVISWITPEIEETRMINSILGEEQQQNYLDEYDAELRERAVEYYTNLATAIDPDVTLTFEFAD